MDVELVVTLWTLEHSWKSSLNTYFGIRMSITDWRTNLLIENILSKIFAYYLREIYFPAHNSPPPDSNLHQIFRPYSLITQLSKIYLSSPMPHIFVRAVTSLEGLKIHFFRFSMHISYSYHYSFVYTSFKSPKRGSRESDWLRLDGRG